MQTTDVEKIVLNSGVGQAAGDKKFLESTEKVIQQIGQGQKPARTCARNLINLSLPQIKNFQGLSTQSFDQRGNYNLGINDLNIFLETDYDLTFKNQGCQITIVFTSSSPEENKYFLELLGFPFRKQKQLTSKGNCPQCGSEETTYASQIHSAELCTSCEKCNKKISSGEYIDEGNKYTEK
ncbi:3683_t:CDS:2 [Funneliformis geosporum]|uniref:3683_t:CDS:1 n=1 Tax=Funneliformis geosporum TaxID=1117311 RepID=A0A9W4WY41_9GLOM|nr:3683_t:CDS:2 [Funneliformis geosporum]